MAADEDINVTAAGEEEPDKEGATIDEEEDGGREDVGGEEEETGAVSSFSLDKSDKVSVCCRQHSASRCFSTRSSAKRRINDNTFFRFIIAPSTSWGVAWVSS